MLVDRRGADKSSPADGKKLACSPSMPSLMSEYCKLPPNRPSSFTTTTPRALRLILGLD